MCRRLFALALVSAALAAIAATPVAATRGVAVDIGKIEIGEVLAPGGTYRLPTLGVRNPGTESGWFSLNVGGTGAEDALPLQLDWFSFTPGRFELEPGQNVPVSMQLHVPADAQPGHYEGLVRAELAAEGTGAIVGAAAAARLTFDVRSSGSIESYVRQLGGFLGSLPAWFYGAVLLSIAAVLLRRFSRRFSIKLERRA